MNLNDIYKEVAKEFNIDEKIVKTLYTNMWEFIRVTITNMNIENIDDIESLKSSFSLHKLGKLHLSKNRINKLKELYGKGNKTES